MDKSKKYKQRSTKHTYKTKDRVTRTPLKTNNDLLYVCFVDRCLYFFLLSIVLFVFSGVLVTRSLVLYVCFVDRCLPLKTNNTMDKSKKYKERSTKHTYKTKDRVTRTH
jgi:hypothetical protein